MPDHLSRAGRSRNMAAIRSKNTKPELALRRGLHAAGVRGWRCHVKGLPSSPDIVFTRWRVAIFVDGAFWHGHPDHFTFGKSGAYWDAKIARTQARDLAANEALRASSWTVIRFWDFEVCDDLRRCVATILDALDSAGRSADHTRNVPAQAACRTETASKAAAICEATA
jgi:DNA mismatch endonuclease (patch repair protein)